MSPLSAPAFSYCFPLLNAMLRESSGSNEEAELLMTRALQVVAEHCQLRATDAEDLAMDEVGARCSSSAQLQMSAGLFIFVNHFITGSVIIATNPSIGPPPPPVSPERP